MRPVGLPKPQPPTGEAESRSHRREMILEVAGVRAVVEHDDRRWHVAADEALGELPAEVGDGGLLIRRVDEACAAPVASQPVIIDREVPLCLHNPIRVIVARGIEIDISAERFTGGIDEIGGAVPLVVARVLGDEGPVVGEQRQCITETQIRNTLRI